MKKKVTIPKHNKIQTQEIHRNYTVYTTHAHKCVTHWWACAAATSCQGLYPRPPPPRLHPPPKYNTCPGCRPAGKLHGEKIILHCLVKIGLNYQRKCGFCGFKGLDLTICIESDTTRTCAVRTCANADFRTKFQAWHYVVELFTSHTFLRQIFILTVYFVPSLYLIGVDFSFVGLDRVLSAVPAEFLVFVLSLPLY